MNNINTNRTRSTTILYLALIILSISIMRTDHSFADGSSVKPSTPDESHERVYQSLDGQRALALITSEELELRGKGKNIVCKYSENRNKLRVIMNEGGTTIAKYYSVTPQGLVDEYGAILYEPEAYADAIRQIDVLKQQLVLAFQSNDFSVIENAYGSNGPPDNIQLIAMQQIMTNEAIASLVRSSLKETRNKIAATDINSISAAVETYNMVEGRYPDSLTALAVGDDPYLKTIPTDPWGHAYKYITPSKRSNMHYDIWSEGENALISFDDIGTWTLEN